MSTDFTSLKFSEKDNEIRANEEKMDQSWDTLFASEAGGKINQYIQEFKFTGKRIKLVRDEKIDIGDFSFNPEFFEKTYYGCKTEKRNL